MASAPVTAPPIAPAGTGGVDGVHGEAPRRRQGREQRRRRPAGEAEDEATVEDAADGAAKPPHPGRLDVVA